MTVAAPPSATCALCELPAGRHAVVRSCSGRHVEFCCMGCANVYSILLESGVLASGQNILETEIFRRSLELGLISTPDDRAEPLRKPHQLPQDASLTGAGAVVSLHIAATS